MAVGNIAGLNVASTSYYVDTEKQRNVNNGSSPFADYLKDALNDANKMIIESERLAEDYAAGRTDNMHQVLIAAEKADIALQFTMQVRNKILDAYNEIMRMQI